MSELGRYTGNPTCQNVVLVIEDTEQDRASLSRALDEHYRIIFAISAQDGICSVRKYVPDLILCDVKIPLTDGGQPDMSGGLSFLKDLRAQASFQHIPVLFITVLEERAYRLKALGLRPDDYIRKSDGYDEIRMRTENVLFNRQIERRVEVDGIAYPKVVLGPLVRKQDLSPADCLAILRLEAILNQPNAESGRALCNPEMSTAELQVAFGRSHKVLERRLKDLFDQPPAKCLSLFRVEYSKHFLRLGLAVKDVWKRSGFGSDDTYSNSFVSVFDMTPSEYVREHGSRG